MSRVPLEPPVPSLESPPVTGRDIVIDRSHVSVDVRLCTGVVAITYSWYPTSLLRKLEDLQ